LLFGTGYASDFIGIKINYKQKIILKNLKLSFNEIKTIELRSSHPIIICSEFKTCYKQN
jgi:hypothetical protein